MAFFMPYNYTARHSEAPLANLLRLVDDLNTFPAASNRCNYAYRAPRAAPRPWNPRFDARETEDSYVLRGELPGLNRDHVTIEFPEAQKIVISGKVVEATSEEAAPAPAADQESTATVDHAEDATMSETASRSSYQATVEDDDEDDEFEIVAESAKKQEKQPAAAEPETQKPEEQKPEPAKERVLRQFSRAFTFSSPVEYDFVTASLKDGLLEVVIPKLKHQPHQVIVN